MKNHKNYKKIINIVLSISIFSSVLSPSFAQAGFFSSSKKATPMLTNFLNKFVGMISFGKKKSVPLSKTENFKIMAAKVGGKALAIGSVAGKGLLTGTRYAGKGLFNTGRFLVYNPIVGVTNVGINGTKFVAKNFSHGYIKTFGQAAAVGTMVTGGVAVASIAALATIFVGYKLLAKYLKDLNDKNKGGKPGDDGQSSPTVQACNTPKKVMQNIKNFFNPKFDEFANNFQEVVLNVAKKKKEDLTKETYNKLDVLKQNAFNKLDEIAVNPVKNMLKSVNGAVNKFVGENESGVGQNSEISGAIVNDFMKEEPANNSLADNKNKLNKNFVELKEEFVKLQQVPVRVCEKSKYICKKNVESRIKFLDMSGYDRNRDFRKLCEKISGDNEAAGKCYLDDLRVATGKTPQELSISQDEFRELVETLDRLEKDLNKPKALVDGSSALSLAKNLAFKEFEYKGRQAAIIIPTVACSAIDKGAKIIYNNKKEIYIVSGVGAGIFVLTTALIWQPALATVVPVTLGVYFNLDKLEQGAKNCKEDCKKALAGTREFLVSVKEKLSDDYDGMKEKVTDLFAAIEQKTKNMTIDNAKKGVTEFAKSESKLYWDFYVKEPFVFYKNLGSLALAKSKNLFSREKKKPITLNNEHKSPLELEHESSLELKHEKQD